MKVKLAQPFEIGDVVTAEGFRESTVPGMDRDDDVFEVEPYLEYKEWFEEMNGTPFIYHKSWLVFLDTVSNK